MKNKVKKLACQTEELLEKADFAKTRIEFLSKDITRYEGLLNAQGGAFAQTKVQEKQKVETLLKEKERLEKALRQECDGALPYALAPNTLSRLLEKIADETQIKQAQSFEKELGQFLTLLQSDIALRSSTTSKIATEAITDNLKEYMATKPKGDLLFDISEREAGMLQQSIEQDSKKAWQRFDLYRTQLADIEQQLEQAAANIARAPEDDQLMDLFEKLRDLDKQREKQRQKYLSLLEDAKQVKQQQLDCVRQVQKIKIHTP